MDSSIVLESDLPFLGSHGVPEDSPYAKILAACAKQAYGVAKATALELTRNKLRNANEEWARMTRVQSDGNAKLPVIYGEPIRKCVADLAAAKSALFASVNPREAGGGRTRDRIDSLGDSHQVAALDVDSFESRVASAAYAPGILRFLQGLDNLRLAEELRAVFELPGDPLARYVVDRLPATLHRDIEKRSKLSIDALRIAWRRELDPKAAQNFDTLEIVALRFNGDALASVRAMELATSSIQRELHRAMLEVVAPLRPFILKAAS